MKHLLTRAYLLTLMIFSISFIGVAHASNHDSNNDDKQKVSYTLGFVTGQRLNQSMGDQDLDRSQFSAGISDAINGSKARYSETQMQQILNKFQNDMLFKAQLQAQKATEENRKQLIHNDESPVDGNTKGAITLVEFFDYQCKHCRDLTPRLTKLKQKNPELRIVYKEFPIFGEKSIFAAKAALASNKQGKYSAFHDALMKSDKPLTQDQVLALAKKTGLNITRLKKDMDNPDIVQELQHNRQLGQALGVNTTPNMLVTTTAPIANAPKDPKSTDDLVVVFVPGAAPIEMLQQTIDTVKSKLPTQSATNKNKK